MAADQKQLRLAIRLSPELVDRVKILKSRSCEATASKAIAWAIRQASGPERGREAGSPGLVVHSEMARLVVEVLQEASKLPFVTSKEKRRLHELSARLYKLVSQEDQQVRAAQYLEPDRSE
jgi:hypothetical protein